MRQVVTRGYVTGGRLVFAVDQAGVGGGEAGRELARSRHVQEDRDDAQHRGARRQGGRHDEHHSPLEDRRVVPWG